MCQICNEEMALLPIFIGGKDQMNLLKHLLSVVYAILWIWHCVLPMAGPVDASHRHPSPLLVIVLSYSQC